MSDRVPRPKDFKYGRDLAPPEKRRDLRQAGERGRTGEPEEERERCQCPCHYEQPGDFDDV